MRNTNFRDCVTPAGFSNTSKGRTGEFKFPQSAGFLDSSGKVKSVKGYVRGVPKRGK